MEQWVQDRIAAGRKLFFNAVAETPEDYMTDQELKSPQPPLAKAPMTDNILDLPKDFSDLDKQKCCNINVFVCWVDKMNDSEAAKRICTKKSQTASIQCAKKEEKFKMIG